MGTDAVDLGNLSGMSRQAASDRPPISRVRVVRPPASEGDSLTVALDGYSLAWPFDVPVGHWTPHGTALPQQGDVGLAITDPVTGDVWLTGYDRAWTDISIPTGQPGDLIESYAVTRADAVLCDGTAYTLSGHPEMAALATNCPGLVSAGILTVPDLRGRTTIGAGAGAGLSARTLGQTGGAENVTLTAAQSGLPAHSHAYGDHPNFNGFGQTSPISGNAVGSLSSTSTGNAGPVDAASSHTNMQPYAVVNVFIHL